MFATFRARLIITVIALVGITAGFVAALAFVLVRQSLRDQLIDDAVARAEFNIAVLATEEQLPADAGRAEFEASGLADRFLLRGSGGVYIEFETDRFASSLALLGASDLLSDELRRIVARGEFGYEFLAFEEGPALVVGGRRPPSGPDFYFVFDSETVDTTLSQVLRVLLMVGAGALVVGALGAGLIARRVLRPGAVAGRAAEAMADGDLSVRLHTGSRDEIGRWAEAFNRMAASLERQIDALVAAQARERQFVADVSHELRTPLTALVNEAAMLQRHLDALPESGRHVGELLIGDVDRLRRLVEELLEISRLDAGSSLDVSYVDLEAFLRAVIADRYPNAELTLNDLHGPVPLDRRALERIVGNLLDNARLHAPGAATRVEVDYVKGHLRITVTDEGPGVATGETDRLFDRFYKTDGSRQGGSGLGLAIARQYARHIGGDLTARPGVEQGMVFELLIPVTDLLHGGDVAATSMSDPDGGSAGNTFRRKP
ncbi:MAG: HAMP domain-containing histidine kinase [Acidimicrobiia bacterium]|nr:HAMP domain-containing histidine kinase [Acidimicrobiia bacterium]